MPSYNYTLADDITFTGETKITFGQSAGNKLLNFSEILRYCADFVMEMYAERGYSRSFLLEHGCAQLVSRSSFHIVKLPKEGDEIRVIIKEEKSEVFQTVRSYRFETFSGEPLIFGKSTWLTIDPTTRRIIQPAKFEFLIKSDYVSNDCKNPGKIKLPEDDEMTLFGEQKILLSHIDGNGHLTNSKYINFALDFLPPEYQQKEIKDFRLNYCKEILLGETMSVFGKIYENENRIVIVGKNKEITSFECELFI